MSRDAATHRGHIVEAASRLFHTRGVQAVGMDAVRTEAGVPLKRLYATFASKDALLVEVLRYRAALWDTGLASISADATTPRDRILAVYDFLDHCLHDQGFNGCGFINTYGELAGISPDVVEVVREQKASFQRYVAGLVEELGAPPVLAAQLVLLAEGAQTTAAIGGDVEAAAHARGAAAALIDLALGA